jgi:hypothetical protein
MTPHQEHTWAMTANGIPVREELTRTHRPGILRDFAWI